ncbi:methyltransferase domain-containing protein [candidate division WOR-3 bacterium]|nr:methyltransferase domain-containing protein [candidate division WOR-3 bacterium]
MQRPSSVCSPTACLQQKRWKNFCICSEGNLPLLRSLLMPDFAQSNLSFRMMAAFIGMRNRLNPPRDMLETEAELKPGSRVLDFGCGPGGHSIAAARIVGPRGRVFALDIHPLALEMVERTAEKNNLTNIETIHSDCETELDTESIDTVLLYDIYHILSEPETVLEELNRVLKPEGRLSFSDHHMRDEDILRSIGNGTGFRLQSKGGKTLTFLKGGNGEQRNT